MPVATIERTLVKSPPELWELVDDRELLGRWCAELFGSREESVRVVERRPGEQLVWESDGHGARVELHLAEKGWGTNVSVTLTDPDAPTGDDTEAALERLVDELGSPQRQPFARG